MHVCLDFAASRPSPAVRSSAIYVCTDELRCLSVQFRCCVNGERVTNASELPNGSAPDRSRGQESTGRHRCKPGLSPVTCSLSFDLDCTSCSLLTLQFASLSTSAIQTIIKASLALMFAKNLLAATAAAALMFGSLPSASATDYLGGWLPTPAKQQCVDICVNSKAAPTCPTSDASCLAKKQRTGDYDYLMLEQLYMPQFCRELLVGLDVTVSHQNVNTYPNGITCKSDVVKSELTIHGLWPNYNAGYAACCNVSDTIGNHPYNAVAFAKNQPALLKIMSTKWIDPTQSASYDTLCEIYNHEFQKHGLCYGASGSDYEKAAVTYFQSTLNVAAKLDSATSQINKWAAAKTTPTLAAVEALYSKKVQVFCSSSDSLNRLSVIRSCFAKPAVVGSTGPFTQVDCATPAPSGSLTPCSSTVAISLVGYTAP